MANQSKLESAAIIARKDNLVKNTYNSDSNSNEYSGTHTRAVSDSTTPIYGKGSGGFLDITNYGGVGGDLDINGMSSIPGSGRIPAFALNSSTWGYGPTALGMQTYEHPDTGLNIGQVII